MSSDLLQITRPGLSQKGDFIGYMQGYFLPHREVSQLDHRWDWTGALNPSRNKEGHTFSIFLKLPSLATQFLLLLYCPFSLLTGLFCPCKHIAEKNTRFTGIAGALFKIH